MSPLFVARRSATGFMPSSSATSARGLRVVAACAPSQVRTGGRPVSGIVPLSVPAPATDDSLLKRARAVALTTACAITVALAVDCDAALANVEIGKTLFNGNCAACHQGGRNVVMAEKTLDKAAIEQYLDGGFTLEAIVYQIENGKGAMPAWGDRLSPEEIQSVAEYVYQTASTGTWDSQ